MRIHSKDHPNKCEVCGKKYAYMQDLNKHMKSHEVIRFQCRKWDKTFEQENIDNKQGSASTRPLPDLNSDEYQAWWDSLDTSQRDAELWRQVNILDAD